jgi:hypothetical protein
MSCYSLIDKHNIRDLNHKYKINKNMQTTRAGNWQPNIVTGTLANITFAEFSFTRSEEWVDDDRIRIQMNLYDLPSTVDQAYIKFKFLFSDELKKFLLSDNAIKWLTIFEIWNEPGWQDKPYPYRISFNLHKKSEEHFFTPVITGEYKNTISGTWEVDWMESLDIDIYTNQIYSLYSKLRLTGDSGIEIGLSGGQNNKQAKLNKRGSMNHSLTSEANIWGLNPIKLYTSPEILNRIEETGAKLKINFYSPEICLPYNI